MVKNSFTYDDLIECAKGKLFGEGNAKLPAPPMLMMDRITKITKDGGNYNKGEIIADGTSDELISGAQGNTQMILELMNAGEESIEEMKAVVPSVNFGRISEQNGITMVHLEYPTKSDPRKDIFAYAISKDWVILEMTTAKTNLEDIFRKLTVTEAADA